MGTGTAGVDVLRYGGIGMEFCFGDKTPDEVLRQASSMHSNMVSGRLSETV